MSDDKLGTCNIKAEMDAKLNEPILIPLSAFFIRSFKFAHAYAMINGKIVRTIPKIEE
jgi:hypothetical protein